MMFRKYQPHLGARVAHVTLDDPEGGARAGFVTEYVGDEETGIIVIRNPDGSSEGYDRREIVPLVGLGSLSRGGPVLLYPHHLWALIKRPVGILSVFIAVLLAAALSTVSVSEQWSTQAVVLVGLGLIVLLMVLVMAASWRRHSKQNAPPQEAEKASPRV